MRMRPHPLLLVALGLLALAGLGRFGTELRPPLRAHELALAFDHAAVVFPEPASGPLMTTQKQCMALAMYWEAKGEGLVGMAAVGAVVLNRMADERFPDTACGVVGQGGETGRCQFSFWCDGRSDYPVEPKPWETAVRLAKVLLDGRIVDPTEGAMFYHATRVKPGWSTRMTVTTQIGNHRFYSDRGDARLADAG